MAFQELPVLQSPNQGLSYGEKTNPSNEVLEEGVGIYVPALYGPFSFPGPQGYCRPLRGRYLTQALIWNIGRQAGYRQYPKKNILTTFCINHRINYIIKYTSYKRSIDYVQEKLTIQRYTHKYEFIKASAMVTKRSNLQYLKPETITEK